MSQQHAFEAPSPISIVTRPRSLNVGLLGCGVVGSAIARLLLDNPGDLARAAGVELRLARVAVRDPHKQRPVDLPPELVTTDCFDIVTDPDIHLVIEVIGGIDPPRKLLLAALGAGKPIITANKELLASPAGAGILRAAAAKGVEVGFEASVGGGIPIVRALRDSLAGDRIHSVTAVLNGTTNYVLTRMEQGSSLGAALAEAQTKGFAEADPSADIEGTDAAAKAALIASLCFGGHFSVADVDYLGISGITEVDVDAARRLGYSIKLVASVQAIGASVSIRVHPTLLPYGHPLAHLAGEDNGVIVQSANIGRLVLQGPGAGGPPTAGAVIGDVIAAARTFGVNTSGIDVEDAWPRHRGVPPTKRFLRLNTPGGSASKVRDVFAQHSVPIVGSVTERDREPLTALITGRVEEDKWGPLIVDLAEKDLWPVSVLPVHDLHSETEV